MVQTNYNINYDMRTSKSMKLKKKLGGRLRKHQFALRFSLMSPLKGSPQFSSNYWRGNQTEVNQEWVEINHCKNIMQSRLNSNHLLVFRFLYPHFYDPVDGNDPKMWA